MGSARLGKLVWPGMIVAGLAVAAAVFAAWPDPTTRTVRLPYGESQPKAPTRVEERTASSVAPARPVAPQAGTDDAGDESRAVEEPEAESGRVLAAVEPVPEEFDPADGPPPVPSEVELHDDWVQESPEELGAEPLPGAETTQSPPAVG